MSLNSEYFPTFMIPCHGAYDTYRATSSCLLMQRYRLGLVSLARYVSPGLSPADGFEHPASTLTTRFPAALGIGHGLPAA